MAEPALICSRRRRDNHAIGKATWRDRRRVVGGAGDGAALFHVVNKLPAKNVCERQNELPPDLYDDLNKAVNNIIKSGVISNQQDIDIGRQDRRRVAEQLESEVNITSSMPSWYLEGDGDS